MEKALSPQVRYLILSGRDRRLASEGVEAAECGVGAGEVGEGLAVEGFMSEEKDFECRNNQFWM